ncbi:hypothetical protein GQ44DRAFT_788182, partial [Phaeosphaeriaceae sp. PMI808]
SLSLITTTPLPSSILNISNITYTTSIVYYIFIGFNNNLLFKPKNIIIDISNLVEFYFLLKNYSIV